MVVVNALKIPAVAVQHVLCKRAGKAGPTIVFVSSAQNELWTTLEAKGDAVFDLRAKDSQQKFGPVEALTLAAVHTLAKMAPKRGEALLTPA